MDTSEYLSMGDAARLLGVTKARISQLAASGTLVCDIVGGRKMVEYNSATAYQRSASEDAVLRPMWDASLR